MMMKRRKESDEKETGETPHRCVFGVLQHFQCCARIEQNTRGRLLISLGISGTSPAVLPAIPFGPPTTSAQYSRVVVVVDLYIVYTWKTTFTTPPLRGSTLGRERERTPSPAGMTRRVILFALVTLCSVSFTIEREKKDKALVSLR